MLIWDMTLVTYVLLRSKSDLWAREGKLLRKLLTITFETMSVFGGQGLKC
jgi:hypothetical protein